MSSKVDSSDYIVDEITKDIKATSKKTLADYLSSRTLGGAETYVQPGHDGTYTYMPPRPNEFNIDSSTGPTEIHASADHHSPSESTQPAFAADLTAHAGNPTLASVVSLEPSARTGMSAGATGGHRLLETVADETSVANSEIYNSADSGVFSQNYNSPENGAEYGRSGESGSPYDSVKTVSGLGDGYTGSPGVLGRNGVNLRSSDTVAKLGDYLSNRTSNVVPEPIVDESQADGLYRSNTTRANNYPIDPGSNYPGSPIGADVKLQGKFADDEALSRGRSYEPGLRNTVKVVPSADRSTTVDAPNGNDVLNSEPIVKPAVSSVLMSNRFNSDNKFANIGYKKAMPRAPTGNTPTDGDEDVYTAMRKKAIAAMEYAAWGETGDKINTSRLGFAFTSLALPFGAIEEKEAKIADVDKLRVGADRAKYIAPGGGLVDLNNPDTVSIDPPNFGGDDTDIDRTSGLQDSFLAAEVVYNNRSFGQLNNYLSQFSGRGTLATIPLALLAYAAIFIGTVVLSLIISIVVNRLPRPDAQISELPRGSERGADFGKFLFDADSGSGILDVLRVLGSLIAKVMGLMQPYESPFDSVAADFIAYFFSALEGALSIIGINTDSFTAGNIGGALLSSAANIAINFGTAPSFYLILVREIARDFYYIGQKLGPKTESSILGILQGLGGMKLTRFVDTCARLGIVNSYAKNIDPAIQPDDPISTNLMYIAGGDSSSPATLRTSAYKAGQARVSRSREVKGSKRLAWAHSSIGYTRAELVTDQVLRAYANYPINVGSQVTGTGALRKLKARKVFSSVGRISAEEREYHEKLLDGEYMPFYFHDLRTNEILSFHAFLSSISDSFSANYNSTEGFGRMDPVQTYKNTTRSISFTFTVVATSKDDHDNMWYSVNKLVNMVYPQWSEGEQISGLSGGKNQTFTQPFSQTIAASPMLRVRIGDVIHSNYSRFALSRIFGLDKADSKLQDVSLEVPTAAVDADITSFEKSTSGDLKGVSDVAKTGVAAEAGSTVIVASNDLNTPLDGGVLNNIIYTLAGTISLLVSPVSVLVEENKYTLYKSATDAAFRQNGKKGLVRIIEGKVVAYSVAESNETKTPGSNIIVQLDMPLKLGILQEEYAYISCTKDQITISTDSVDPSAGLPPGLAALLGLSSPPDDATQVLVQKFLDPTTNAVVRSFEQGSGGRGLAGFITQLGMEYGSTDITWTTDAGSRAPNMVTVSVSFTPVHDIPMGLAADGTARAVAYPVGDLTRRMHFPDRVQADYSLQQLRKVAETK